MIGFTYTLTLILLVVVSTLSQSLVMFGITFSVLMLGMIGLIVSGIWEWFNGLRYEEYHCPLDE